MSYLPEDPEWDKTINVWLHTIRVCARCHVRYAVIDNIGSWRCRQSVYDKVNKEWTNIPSDHADEKGKKYTDKDDVTVPVSVMPFFKGKCNARAVTDDVAVRQLRNGTKQPFPAVKIRRYDSEAYLNVEYGYVDENPFRR